MLPGIYPSSGCNMTSSPGILIYVLAESAPKLRSLRRSLALKVDRTQPEARSFFDVASPAAARFAFDFPMAPEGGVVADK